MSRARIIILAVAAFAAIGLALLVRGLASGGDEPVAQPVAQVVEKPMAKVLVAARDLPVGARIAESDLTWQDWPLEGVNEQFITDGTVAIPTAEQAEGAAEGEKTSAEAEKAKKVADAAMSMIGGGANGPIQALTGSVVREAVLKGEPVIERKLVRAGQSGYMAVVLQPGMRAMGIPVSVESAAGGFILPGDRVDVLMSRQVTRGSTTSHVTETAMRNVKVLAIDQTTKAEDGAQSVVGATATLEVSESDAAALAQADAQGELALVLRSYADVSGPSGSAGPQLAATGEVRVWRDGSATAVSSN